MSIQVNSLPKDRLLEAARELFLRDGIPSTGINTVTAKANVARMTLYNNYASRKMILYSPFFKREAEIRRDAIVSTQGKLEGPIERILALFSVAQEIATLKGFRGCAFINLAIEAAAPDSALHSLAKKHKDWIRENIKIQLLLGDIPGSGPLADQICVLWDGGIIGAYVHQSERPILVARDAARTLIGSGVL